MLILKYDNAKVSVIVLDNKYNWREESKTTVTD